MLTHVLKNDPSKTVCRTSAPSPTPNQNLVTVVYDSLSDRDFAIYQDWRPYWLRRPPADQPRHRTHSAAGAVGESSLILDGRTRRTRTRATTNRYRGRRVAQGNYPIDMFKDVKLTF